MQKVKNIAKSLSGFLKWTKDSTPKSGARILYRGQCSCKWPVEPSLCRRPGPKNQKNEIGAFELWQRTSVIVRKAQELSQHREKGEPNKSVLLLLADLQHFGAATCLIDFTRSPLVALWFACQPYETASEDDPDPGGKVIALDSSECESVMADKHHDVMKNWRDRAMKSKDQDDSDLWIWPPGQLHNRIIVQQSEFVFGKTIIDEADKKTCIIPANKKEDILNQLKKAGISEESLFPDLDRFVRANRHDTEFPDISGEQHYQEGVECLDKKEYKYALQFFRMAEKAYQAEGTDPPQKLIDKIKKTEDTQNQQKIKGALSTIKALMPPDNP